MQVHAQSTMTRADSRMPYIHLGYLSASSRTWFGTFDSELFIPGAVLFLVGYLIALKFNYGWFVSGIARIVSKVGIVKILVGIVSILLIFACIFVYCFAGII